MRQVNCTLVFADGTQVPKGTPIHTELVIETDPGGPSYGGRIEENGRLIFRFPDCAPQGHGASLRVQTKGTDWVGRFITPADAPQRIDVRQPDGTTITWNIGPSTECPHSIVLQRSAQPGPFRRSGRVRAQGRCWVDDNGLFFPLGETLFWAPRGWKFENDRIRQNLKWLSEHRWDAIRILCAVGWPGNEIDPTWPDYQPVLAGLIDAAYDEYGLRVIPTVWGGGGSSNPLAVTDKVVEVIKGREHKILYAEAVNESFNNLADDAVVREMSKRLMATGVLTASSCLNPPTEQRFAELASGCSNMVTVHLDRSGGDLDWRFVRQAWDVKSFPWPTSQNEPKGPGSSVSSTFSALQIAQSRAVGIVCGAGAYVLHNGAGIYGQRHTHPGTGVLRTANLFEMPGIDAIMKAVRGIDTLIPTGVENWQKANDGWTSPLPEHGLPAVDFWEDAAMHGVNKNYCAVDGNRKFVCAPSGVRAPADGQVGGTFKARWACKVKAYDPLTLEIEAEATLAPDQTFTLPGRPDSMRAYIVVGERQ